jgi:hypothetical protein
MPDGLDELGAARLAEGREILAGLAAEYDGLVAAAAAGYDCSRPDDEGPAVQAVDAWEAAFEDGLVSMPAEQRRCLLFALGERLSSGGQQYSRSATWFYWLSRGPLGLVAGDVRLLAALVEPGPKDHSYEAFEFVVDMVEELLREHAVGAVALAEAVADQVLDWNAMVYRLFEADYVLSSAFDPADDPRCDVAELRDRALELAGRPPAPPALEGPVSRDDGYGVAVIGWLGLVEDWPAGVRALLEHCSTARKPRPGPKWEKDCQQRLAAVGDPAALLGHLLELVLTAEPVSYLTDHGRRKVLIGFNEQLVKGLVWAAGVLDPPWLAEVLRPLAARCLRLCSGHVFRDTVVPGEKIPYACFRALALSGSDASLTALARIGPATSNGSVLKNLAKTLDEASAKRGISSASLLDHLTPDHGLDARGQVRVDTGAGAWMVRLDDRHGAVADGPPDAEVPQEVAEVVTEVKATVAAVRDRLDALFADRRQWHIDDFAEDYVRHPLTGWLARRLVWTFTGSDGLAIRGLPGAGGDTVLTPQGSRPAPAGSLVQLTHPVLLEQAQLVELRRMCQDQGVSQPIRQLWRETYQLTAAEQDGLSTGRYSGHVLRFNQCYGMARRRGWVGGFLAGGWDGGQSAIARRDYPATGLRASWAIAELDSDNREMPDLCLTENVSFSALHDVVPVPIPLADVPPQVFSEAMRDLGLVVSVSTVANDPAWLERYDGQPVLDRYWDYVARGGLDQLRVHRRAILASYCEGPAASERYHLTDTDLVVKGALASYRIDLATANVRTEPAGKWLSFDTKLTLGQARNYDILGVPAIDDDEILHRILIRAAILADDVQLASRKLLKQIRG